MIYLCTLNIWNIWNYIYIYIYEYMKFYIYEYMKFFIYIYIYIYKHQYIYVCIISSFTLSLDSDIMKNH